VPSPVLVTGGTGRLGRLVVPRLVDAGCDVRVLTRRSREATRHRVEAAARAGSPHLVYVSIVGIDHLPAWGYPRAKLQAEQVVADSGLPWTILRATQFYDYVLAGLRKMARLPVVLVPAGFLVQPIDPDEVAARLVELTLGEPAGRVPDMGGPRVISWADMLRGYLRASRRRRWLLPVRIPGTRAVRAGGLLPPPAHPTGRRTWDEFLTATLDRQNGLLDRHYRDLGVGLRRCEATMANAYAGR
jgi:uncharacterized protein YbjT (DUF2867 family)